MASKPIRIAIVGDTSKFEQAIEGVEGKLQAFGGKLESAGKKLTLGVTAPILALGAASFKAAKDFNAGMANIATLIPGNVTRVTELKRSVQDLAIETAKSTDDLADGLYNVISAFGDTSDSVRILESNAKAAAAGLASTTDSINLTSAITKAYGDTSADAVAKVADLALMTVRMGQTTFPELASSMGKVTPIAEAMGQSQEELFAVFSTLTGVTGTAAEVSTQYRGVLAGLLNPTKDLGGLIEKMGFKSGKAMLESEGLVGTLQKIIAEADRSGQPITKYLSSIEAVPAAMALAGPQADKYAESLAALGDSAGAVDAAFAEVTDGVNAAGFKFDQMKVKAQVLFQRLGDGLAPALNVVFDAIAPLIDKLVDLAGRFADLSPRVQKFILLGVGIVAAIGPVLVILGKVAVVAATVGAVVGKVAAVMALFASPIGLVVLAIGALGAALFTAWGGFRRLASTARSVADTVRRYVLELWPRVKAVVETAVDWIRRNVPPVFEAIRDAAAAAGGWLIERLVPVFGAIRDAAATAFGWLREHVPPVFGAIRDAVADSLGSLAEHVPRVFEAVRDAAATAFEWLRDHAPAALGAMKDAAMITFGWLADNVPRILTAVKDAAMETFGWLAGVVPAALIAVRDAARDAFEWIGRKVAPALTAVRDAAVAAFGSLKDAAVAAFGWLRDKAGPALDQAREAFKELVELIERDVLPLWDKLVGVARSALTLLSTVVGAKIEELIEKWGPLLPALRLIADEIVEAFKTVAVLIVAPVVAAVAALVGIWKAFGDTIVSIVGHMWDTVIGVVDGALDVIGGLFDLLTALMTGKWGDAWESVKRIVAGAWRVIFSIVAGQVRVLQDILAVAWRAIGGAVAVAWTWISELIVSSLGTIAAVVASGFDPVVVVVRGLSGRITSAASGMWDGVTSGFRSALNTIIDGWNRLSFTMPSIDTKIPGVGTLGGWTIAPKAIPRLAMGGRVRAGSPYIVGDGGEPELFMPDRPGSVIPASRLPGGAMAGAPTINVSVASNADPFEIAREVAWQLRLRG